MGCGFCSCYLTNNILGAGHAAENRSETDEQSETDEVPDLPRLPATFLAHHAKGTRAPLSDFSAKIFGAILHFCHSTTSRFSRSAASVVTSRIISRS